MDWAKGLPRWAPYIEGGVTYELSHLHPFRYELLQEAKTGGSFEVVEIRVAFESRVFTTGP
jgi:hypothetical protein